MKKRFIVCVDDPSSKEGKEFVKYVNSIGLGWWHWISGVWFLSDSQGKMTAEGIRDVAGEYFNNKRRFVVELSGKDDTWSGFGPKNAEKNMFTWIHDNWH